MIIKKRQLFLDAPYIITKQKKQEISDSDNEQINAALLISQAEKESEKIILEAKSRAEKIVEDSFKESQRILAEAQKQAEDIQRKAERKYHQVNAIISKFEEALNLNLAKISEDLTDIVALLIEKIVYRELDKTDFEKKIRDILRKVVGMKYVKVTMSLTDFEEHKLLVQEFESLGVEVSKSFELKPGEVIVDTEIGVINGTKQKAKELVEQLIEEVFGSD